MATVSGVGLPELQAPSSLPIFRGDGHIVQPDSVYAPVATATGHSRNRRVDTTAPMTVAVDWLLSAAQMEALYNWYHVGLNNGTSRFSTRVMNIGPGLLWYAAQWKEPYLAVPMNRGFWHVTGAIRVFGNGSLTGPISTSLDISFGLSITGSAKIAADYELDVTFGLALQSTVELAITFGLELDGSGTFVIVEYTTYRLREDGTTKRLREGGGFRERESTDA